MDNQLQTTLNQVLLISENDMTIHFTADVQTK